MSNIHRRTSLAIALAGTFAIAAPSAMAATLTQYPSATATYAYNLADVDILPAASLFVDAAFQVNIATTDQIIGRTTGFALRVTLPAGVTFSGGVPFTGGTALPAGWTVALAAGTGAGQNIAVFTFTPGAGASGIVPGQLFAAGFFNVTGATGSVNATVDLFDPVTTNEILNSMAYPVLTSVDALQYTVDIANPRQRIDVGANAAPSRTLFAPNGFVNSSSDGTSFDAGTVNITNPPNALPSGMIFDQAGNAFAWANGTSPGDTVDLSLVGNFSTFMATGGAIYLGAPGSCAATVPGGAITATINATGTSADFGTQAFNSVDHQDICFIAPGGTVTINPTTIVANVTATRTLTTKTDTGSANALSMQYNGPVQVVYTFNPGNNTNQQSFLRVSNTSNAAGLISITGVDDTGHTAGPVTFNLGAGQSIQLNSTDLENGNAAKGLTGSLGTGTGKWILTVVGQVGSMEVTNLNRNNGSGTLNNLGRPVTGDGRIQ